ARSLMETRGPQDAEVRELLETAIGHARERRSKRLLIGALVIELERRGHPHCLEPLEPVRLEYDTLLSATDLFENTEIIVRAELPTASSLLRRGEAEAALVAASLAADRAVAADLLAYAPLAQLQLSEILASLGKHAESDRALERGREQLRLTAERIEDPAIR